jgi:hypothetical protein
MGPFLAWSSLKVKLSPRIRSLWPAMTGRPSAGHRPGYSSPAHGSSGQSIPNGPHSGSDDQVKDPKGQDSTSSEGKSSGRSPTTQADGQLPAEDSIASSKMIWQQRDQAKQNRDPSLAGRVAGIRSQAPKRALSATLMRAMVIANSGIRRTARILQGIVLMMDLSRAVCLATTIPMPPKERRSQKHFQGVMVVAEPC